MNLFSDYVQPLNIWLQENPNWALFFTFLIALSESLAIVGSIIPGSVTMTAIGILAGSGIMRIDLTLLAATLGAIAGDSLSYALGYYYSNRLLDMWPFSKYPTLLAYGKDFFQRHGGKSVLFGRFVGPLRSIIPVIAGIMHMKQWRFLIANFISAILWSLLYVLPGILIGAASHELSAESSTRLIVFILIVLAGIWFVSLIIKWLLIKLNNFLQSNLHNLWIWFESHSLTNRIVSLVTPKAESNHFNTAALVILILSTTLGFIICLILSMMVSWYPAYNLPLHIFMQSFSTPSLQSLFIICTQLTSITTLLSVFVFSSFWFLYSKNPRAISYTFSVLIASLIFAYTIAYLCNTPRPQGFIVPALGSSLPPINLLVASALYTFILLCITNQYSLMTNALKGFIFIVLGLSGFAALYLGDHWFTDIICAYFAGASICLIHYLLFRKSPRIAKKQDHTALLVSSLVAIILYTTAFSAYMNLKVQKIYHLPFQKEYSLNEHDWWKQNKPILPVYLLNRIGKRLTILNIQYSGDLDLLQENLEKNGWKVHTESFLIKLVQKISGQANKAPLPLFDFLFENKQPELTMTFTQKDSDMILELRMWESSYYLDILARPIWIGSISLNKNSALQAENKAFSIDALNYVKPNVTQFKTRRIQIPQQLIKPTIIPTTPIILLIKTKPDNSR